MGQLLTIYMAADRVTSPLISLVSLFNVVGASEPLVDALFPVSQETTTDELRREICEGTALLEAKAFMRWKNLY